MPRLRIVTDTTADIPASILDEFDIEVVAARVAFDDAVFADTEISPAEFYDRMEREETTPRPFGVPQAEYDRVFAEAAKAGDALLCLAIPFDVGASLSTARAALVAHEDQDFKVLNPGVASAGLCSFVVSLAIGVRAGWSRSELMRNIDEVEPLCDTIFVPADSAWLQRSGRLATVEQRIGRVGNSYPVVRVSTRITGVALDRSHDAALRRAVMTAGARAEEAQPVVVTVDHAASPDKAEKVARMMENEWNVARTIITELSPTIGSQVGPGAVGIGVAPAPKE